MSISQVKPNPMHRRTDRKTTKRTLVSLGLLITIHFSLCHAAKAAAPVFPLKVSPNGRYLVDQNNVPFLYHADTCWQMLWKLSKPQTSQYLQNRKQKGFTAIQVQLLPHRVIQINYDGYNPFVSPGDMSRPNPAYFRHVDWVLEQAGQMGLCVMLAPNWLSQWEQDWRLCLKNENAENWGRYLGKRYGKFKHVIWMHGGDADPKDLIDEIRQVAAGIKATAPWMLQTYHAGGKSSSNFFHEDTWLDWNTAYDYGNIYPQVYADYNRTPTKPVYLGESHYEDNNNVKTAHDVRKQAYWAMLSGCAGHAYGHGDIWRLTQNWVRAMDAPGAYNMTHLKNLLTSRDWYKLVPDQQHKLLTAGCDANELYAAAAGAEDGSFALVYVPTPRTITVDANWLKIPLSAKWFDPTNGSYKEIATITSTGSHQFTPANKNYAGDTDWVLVLEAGATSAAPIAALHFGLPAGQPPAPVSLSGRPVRIMPLGDSITAAADPGYRGYLYNMLTNAGYRVDFVGSSKDLPANGGDPDHEGHGGFTIGPGPSKADEWADGKGNIAVNIDSYMSTEPNIILLLIGVNDYFNIADRQPQYNPDQQGPEHLANLIDKIHAIKPDTKVFLASLPPVGWDPNFARQFNAALPGIAAARTNVIFVDMNRQAGFEKGDRQVDGLHPSATGCEKIAKTWFTSLSSYFQKPFADQNVPPALQENKAPSAPAKRPMGPLAIHPENPRYFQNTAAGEVVYLTGSHTWANLVDIGPNDPPPQFDFTAYIDWMKQLNHNFIRMWTWELVTWNTNANGENKIHTAAPQPWARTGPGTALDGKPKFDLTKFDPAYFDRLRSRVAAARDRGIYVSIMLFEGWGLQFAPKAWEGHPFNPQNNINGIDGDPNKNGKGLQIYTLANKDVTTLQEAYVRKVIDTVNELDNVLYEISNENHPPSTEWQYHIIRYIKDYEKNKPQQHPVGMTFQYHGGKNQTLFESPADWISPNPDGGYRDDPPAADGKKVILNDTDHLWGIGGNQQWVWKSFLRGHNPIFMDPYGGVVLGERFDPRWDPIRKSLGYTLMFAGKMDLAKMQPLNDLASTKYCLANPGREYLVYNPSADANSITVNLKAGNYNYEWFNPNSGKVESSGTIEAKDGEQSFPTPFKADAVLYVVLSASKKE